MANSSLKQLRLTCLSGALLLLLAGCGTVRTVKIDSTPPGATVLINGQQMPNTTPVDVLNLKFDEKLLYQVQVKKPDYEEKSRTLTLADVQGTPAGQPVVFSFTLEELRRQIPVQVVCNVEGFSLAVAGKAVAAPTAAQVLEFTRSDSRSEWSKTALRVEKSPSHKAKDVSLTPEQAASLAKTPTGAGKLEVSLDEIRREVATEIKADQEGATVLLDDKEIGKTPLKVVLIFTREDGSQPWNTASIKIEKVGYEYRPVGAAPLPAYTHSLTLEEATAGFQVQGFVPIRFHPVPVRTFEIVADKLAAVTTTNSAEVSQSGEVPPPALMIPKVQGNPLILNRIAAVPDQAKVVFALPLLETRATGEGEIVGVNLMMGGGGGLTPMTEGRFFDTDPFVAADGFLYFSSDRQGKRSIWRRKIGQGGYTPLTGTQESVDTEPAVSTDTENPRLAFASRPRGAPATTPSYVWVANADGRLATQYQPGRSPSWSPDGKRLAYVSPDNKIWTMNAEAGDATQRTTGTSKESYPVWVPPAGKHILFVSDRNKNDIGEQQLDIWIMTEQGEEQRQITSNGSLDTAPAVSSDGKYVWFVSNRGASRAGIECLQIWRIELRLQ